MKTLLKDFTERFVRNIYYQYPIVFFEVLLYVMIIIVIIIAKSLLDIKKRWGMYAPDLPFRLVETRPVTVEILPSRCIILPFSDFPGLRPILSVASYKHN